MRLGGVVPDVNSKADPTSGSGLEGRGGIGSWLQLIAAPTCSFNDGARFSRMREQGSEHGGNSADLGR